MLVLPAGAISEEAVSTEALLPGMLLFGLPVR
jgi:hypothetical protein